MAISSTNVSPGSTRRGTIRGAALGIVAAGLLASPAFAGPVNGTIKAPPRQPTSHVSCNTPFSCQALRFMCIKAGFDYSGASWEDSNGNSGASGECTNYTASNP